jgi:hypothetical protein
MIPKIKKEYLLSESVAEHYHKSFMVWVIGVIIISLGFVLQNNIIMVIGVVCGIMASNLMTAFGIMADLKSVKKSMVIYRSITDSWYIIITVLFYIMLNS